MFRFSLQRARWQALEVNQSTYEAKLFEPRHLRYRQVRLF